jgi:hypothetical protein
MEKIIEFLLAVFWDSIKTMILQWIIDQAKALWASIKNFAAPQYA